MLTLLVPSGQVLVRGLAPAAPAWLSRYCTIDYVGTGFPRSRWSRLRAIPPG